MSLTGLAFLLVFAGGLTLSVIRGPVWGLYTYIAVFYLHPPSRWWGVGLPDVRWALVAAAVTLVCVMVRRRDPDKPHFLTRPLAQIFLLFVLWMWIQAPWVISEYHMDGVILFTKYFVLLYLIYEILNDENDVRNFLLAHVVGCFYLGWLAYNLTSGGRLEGVGGPGIDDSNTMAMHLGTGVIVGAMLLMTEKSWRFWLVFLTLPFLLNGMILGNSRGAFLGLFVGGFTLMLLKPPEFTKRFWLFGALGGVLFLMLAHDYFWERISSLTAVTSEEKELDKSAASRLVVVQAQFEMLVDHPMGVGHKGTAVLSPDYISAEFLTSDPYDDNARAARSSHNTVMSVVVDHGIPGIALLIALLVWCRRAIRATTKAAVASVRARGYAAAVACALVTAIVAGMFSPYLKAEIHYWLLSLLMSLEAMLVARRRRSSSDVVSSRGATQSDRRSAHLVHH